MIKRKVGIDNNVALKKACENNSIILTTKETNLKPVGYVDLKGKEKILGASTNYIIRGIEAEQLNKITEFNIGDIIKVYGRIKKGGHEKIQVFEGTVLKKQGTGTRETFTVRKLFNGVGVEKTWYLHSPNVEKIEVVRRGKVRRAKLNYLRERINKKGYIEQ